MVRQGQQNTDECPRCSRKDEHTEHVILCQGEGSEKKIRTAFEEIEIWLMTTTTTEIRKAVIDLILEYRHSEENMEENDLPDKINKAKERQKKIGLFSFMCGIFGIDWTRLQDKHLQQI